MADKALLVMDVQRDVVRLADAGSGYLPRLRPAMRQRDPCDVAPLPLARPV